MNTLLLQPSDVLFFRDGRPMGGSLSGHGAAWPMPTVLHAALHAALWRADLNSTLGGHVHGHDHRWKDGRREQDARKFGSVQSAGPFPVLNGEWLFPRPLDVGLNADEKDSTSPTLLPLALENVHEHSSLPAPLKYPVANTLGPTKKSPRAWWNAAAWRDYLQAPAEGDARFLNDGDFSDAEFTYGIGIDPATGTQNGEQFYSAHYLRLKQDAKTGVRLGVFAQAFDKINDDPNDKRDLIAALFRNDDAATPIVVGGQQRICSVERHSGKPLPLPLGLSEGFSETGGKFRVKWTLLAPVIFPAIESGLSKRGTQRSAHPGGYLPNWVCPTTGKVLLETVTSEERRRRRNLNSSGKGHASFPNIDARLVAAVTGKPVPISGYALVNDQIPESGGEKFTRLAVPAGSVYYFEAGSSEAAEKLAAALNWHGAESAPTTILNRRSTLFGEKGFGIGVCSGWEFHSGKCPA